MRKLIAMLAVCAGAMGLHAATTGTGFEFAQTGEYTNVFDAAVSSNQQELDTTQTPGAYWDVGDTTKWEEGGGLIITNYDGDAYTGARHSAFTAQNEKLLKVQTKHGNPVTRYINATNEFGEHAEVTIEQAKSYYFDSLVKFTAFETNKSASAVLGDDGKLAIWLQTDLDEELNPTETNLVISAGYLLDGESSVVPTNYICTVANNVDVTDGDWHRVTVKAFGSIYADSTVPGFAVLIDGKVVSITNAQDNGVIAGDTRINKDGQHWGRRLLFPSARLAGTTKLASISFDGDGAVDELVFSEDTDFNNIKDPEGNAFTITLDPSVSNVVYSVSGGSQTNTTETKVIYYEGESYPTVTIVRIDPAAGYTNASVDPADSTEDIIVDGNSYTPTGNDKSITISAVEAVVMVDDGSGTPVGYTTVSDAFDYINGLLVPPAGDIIVTLMGDVDENISLANGDVQVVLDLAGHKITGVPGLDGAINLDAGTLIITNTVGVGVVDAGTSDNPASLWVNGGSIKIRDGVYDGLVYVLDADDIVVSGGKFNIAAIEAAGDDETYLDPIANNVVPDGYELVAGTGADAGYYIVKEPSSDPIPPISPDATPAQVAEAIDEAGFADDNVAELIDGDAATYLSFKTWAGTAGSGTSSEREAAVVASTNAAVSYKLKDVVALPTLFENYPDIDFSAVLQNGDSWNVTLHLKDGESTVALNALIAGYIGKVFKGIAPNAVTTACTLEDVTNASVDGVGRVTLTIAPPDPDKGFFKFKAD